MGLMSEEFQEAEELLKNAKDLMYNVDQTQALVFVGLSILQLSKTITEGMVELSDELNAMKTVIYNKGVNSVRR